MKKKVLFSATVDSHILHFHVPYLKLFKEKGYEVHVATNGNEKIPYCDKKHIISFERSPYKLNNLKAIKQLKKIIDEENFEIIHTHTPMGSVVTRLASIKARKKGTRLIYTAHGFHFYKGASKLNWLLFYPVEKILSRYTDCLITINKEDYELAKNKFKKCKQIEYIPGVGIDEEKFNFKMTIKEKNDLRKSLGLKKDDFVLIYPAELSERKRQEWLINSLNNLMNKHNNIHLLLPGKDSLNGKLKKIIEKLKLENQVHLLGYRKDIQKLLYISDIAVSSARQEGLPVNIMEAMYVGLPIVASNCRGNRDLVKNSKNGYLINLEDNKNFSKKVEKLYKDKKQYKGFKKYNENEIKQYKLENIVMIMEKIYFHPKRIMHLLSSNIYSGAENVACNIIKELNSKYDICYCSPKGNVSEKLKDYSIKYIGIKRMSYHEIKKAVDDFKPDIIHAHDNKATVFASFFHKKCKIISHIHGNNKIMNTKNIKSMIFNIISHNISKFIWVSNSAFNDYYYSDKIKDKSLILYNVIDDSEIYKKVKDYKVTKDYDLIYLGRLGYPKNPVRLLQIIEIIKSKNKNIRLAIVGDGEERVNLEKIVAEKKLEKNVEFFGYQKNPFPILFKSKIMIMTSLYEGTPMCALEAQALGKPIVATPVDGLKDIIKNGYNGYLVSDNNEFAEKINKLLKMDLSENVLKSFKEKNNIKKYIDTIEKLY